MEKKNNGVVAVSSSVKVEGEKTVLIVAHFSVYKIISQFIHQVHIETCIYYEFV